MLLDTATLDRFALEFREHLEEQRFDEAVLSAHKVSALRAAPVLMEASEQTVLRFLDGVGRERAAAICSHLPLEFRARLLQQMETSRAAALIDLISPHVVVISSFEDTLVQIAILAAFLPMITETTITDITGVSIYLGLCTLFLTTLLAGG